MIQMSLRNNSFITLGLCRAGRIAVIAATLFSKVQSPCARPVSGNRPQPYPVSAWVEEPFRLLALLQHYFLRFYPLVSGQCLAIG